MAWNEVLLEDEFSVGFAVESDVNTPGSSWVWIDAEMPQVSFDAAQTDAKRSMRSRGAATRIFSGRVWPKIAIRFPVVGQLVGYDPESDTPGLKAANAFLDVLGGNASLGYQASSVSPSDANTITCSTSIPKIGCLVAALESDGSVAAKGIVKSLSGGGPWTTELFDDLGVAPGASTARLPSYTIYPSNTAPASVTIRVTGTHSDMERRFIGCVMNKASFAFDGDWRLYCTVELTAYGGEMPKGELPGSGGGIQAITDCLALEPLVERGGARWVLGSNIFSDLSDGTLDPDGSPDIRDVTWGWEFPHYVATKPGGRQGVYEVLMRSPMIDVGFSVPDISDYEVDAGHFAEEAWRNLTDFSLSGYLGDTPGKLLSVNFPRLMPTSYPEVTFVEGARHRKVSARCTHYDGDGASTDAGNAAHRLSVA